MKSEEKIKMSEKGEVIVYLYPFETNIWPTIWQSGFPYFSLRFSWGFCLWRSI